MKNWTPEIRVIFDRPRPQVRALSDGVTVRVEVADQTPVMLPDGCRGYRREWNLLCESALADFNFGNIITALTIRNIEIRYEAVLP